MDPRNIDVSFFAVVSLLSPSAYQMLGLSPSERDSGAPADVEGARTVLGYLIMLREKTAGNLTEEEEMILNDAITAVETALPEA